MREVKGGPNTVKLFAYTVVGLVALAWAAAFVLVAIRIPQHPPVRPSDRRRDRGAPVGIAREPELVS